MTAGETIDAGLFWALVAGLAWCPFWFGSNTLGAWGINAVVFCGLALAYEAALIARGQRHPVAAKYLAWPAALFAAVVIWIVVQNATWTPASLHHPVWALAAAALDREISGSISVNRDLTTLALVRLITAAGVFWLAVQLCRSAARAIVLLKSVAAIAAAYAAYGLVAHAVMPGQTLWAENQAATGLVTSTFFNRNSFATYAGIGLVITAGLALRFYRHEVAAIAVPYRLRAATLLEATGRRGALLLAGGFVIFAALILTGSRGGAIATFLGLTVLVTLTLRRRDRAAINQRDIIAFGAMFLVAAFLAVGDALVGKIAQSGLGDERRLAVYAVSLHSIADAPLLGYGYGTFVDVFPMYRDRSLSVLGTWEMAHNTYLEIFQGLGLVFGAALVTCVALLSWRCVKGAATRQENATVPCIAASVTVLVGVNALVDFSLQIQAVTLTFMAVLGAGVAQSESSRVALND